MDPGQRLEVEIAEDQRSRIDKLLRIRRARVVEEQTLAPGRACLLLEKLGPKTAS